STRPTSAAGLDDPVRLDWHAIGGANGVPAFGTGMTASTRLHVHADASVSVAGFVVGKGTLDLKQGVITSSAGGPTLTDADLFALTVTGVQLFVGTGGTLTRGTDRAHDVVGHTADAIGFSGSADSILLASAGSGTVEVVKTTADANAPALTDAPLLELSLTDVRASVGDPNSVHLDLTGASLALAILSAPAPTTPATDSRRWIALKAHVDSAGIVTGIPDLSLTITGLDLAVNKASGAYDGDGAGTAQTGQAATPLDWKHALNLNDDTSFGDADHDIVTVGGTPLDFTG